MVLDLAAELERIERRQAELAGLLDKPIAWHLPIDVEAELERIDRRRAELAQLQIVQTASPREAGWSDRKKIVVAFVGCSLGAGSMFGAGMLVAWWLPGDSQAWGLVGMGFAALVLLVTRR